MSDHTIDYGVVRAYWEQAGGESALTASCMAHEQGLPEDSVRYRLDQEALIVDKWFAPLDPGCSVLDVGAGAGLWSARFARHFARVVAVEQSKTMCDVAAATLASHRNAELRNEDALRFQTDEKFGGIFLGGMLMYLNRADVIALLHRLVALLDDGGRIILRESTVRKGLETRAGRYQVVYRTPLEYASIAAQSGLQVTETQLNTGYQAMEIGERFVDYLRLVPYIKSREVTRVGASVWAVLKATEPISLRLLPRLIARLGVPWPHLQNHFFLVERPPS